MSLAGMTWKRVTVHEMVAAFLLSEPHRLAGVISPAAANRLMPMITSPNLSDPMENRARRRLLHLFRRQLIGEIPPDTRWFEVRNLTDNELPELHAIARCGWDAPGKDNNELLRVAARNPRQLSRQPSIYGNSLSPSAIVHRLGAGACLLGAVSHGAASAWPRLRNSTPAFLRIGTIWLDGETNMVAKLHATGAAILATRTLM
jgi:hypothetical protein